MDIMAIFGLVEKGLEVVSTMVTVERDALPAIEVVKDLVTGAKEGTVTQTQLDQTEALLDSLIVDFNKPI